MVVTVVEKLPKTILEYDDLFSLEDEERIWLKYCGFLDLSLGEFMAIQQALLRDQISLVSSSIIGRKLMRGRVPASIAEFRRTVPLTRYGDYQPYLDTRDDSALAVKPVIWAHTSGRTGLFKWTPYSLGQLGRLADDTIAAFILAAAGGRGEVNVNEGIKVLLNLPPVPYITGIMAAAAAQRIAFRAIPPLDEAGEIDFHERISRGFTMALSSGADFAASIAAVLVKVGESFQGMGKKSNLRFILSLPPRAALRVLLAFVHARLEKRALLPRDLWQMRGLVCGGTDTSIYRAQIAHYWGIEPLDAYGATETGLIAMQAWDKTTMTFIPYSNFYEFIPEGELKKSEVKKGYQPSTLLLDEVEPGETYELVITSFNGGPYLRYRMGDLVTITARSNQKAGIPLPQMVFRACADEIIDLSGFARLDEKTIWTAIGNSGVAYTDWTARKEYRGERPVLHVYIEPQENEIKEADLARFVDQELVRLDHNYRDYKSMTGSQPMLVSLLEIGAFRRYADKKRAGGCDLAHLKPPHINASDSVISELLRGGDSAASV